MRQNPIPTAPITLKQTWCDLLFAHWPVPKEVLRDKLPAQLELDTFDGFAWLGVVPFRMVNVKPVWSPMSFTFLELNVRTYVTHKGYSGVYFFSLDASNPLAFAAARVWPGLPYYFASMNLERSQESISFTSQRIFPHTSHVQAAIDVQYRPASEVQLAERGSLAEFLTERYCLFQAQGRGNAPIFRVDIDHKQWPLQQAEAEFRHNSIAEASDLAIPKDQLPILHFSKQLETVAWSKVY